MGLPTEENEFGLKKIGDVNDKEKLKIVLLKLIKELSSVKYKTELIKLSFILDYKYCQQYNTSLGPTTVEYFKYNYGPYSESIVEALNELKQEGKINEIVLSFGLGYSFQSNGEEMINEEVGQLIKEVVTLWGSKSLREMKNYIYDLEEFKQAEFGKPIKLSN